MMLFLLGGFLGAALAYAFYWRAQREAARLEEQNLLLMEERQIVLDYMHTMVDAVGERLTRDELFQRIVHAATLSTGALSACIFEKGVDYMMRGVAVEGLFPPHRPIPDAARMQLGSRARFIEQVLKSESFPVGDGIVGRVAATGRGELITDAPSDARIVKHDDVALTVRSVIAAPIKVRNNLIGVLCVCNAADGLPFTGTDYSLVAALAEQAGLAVHNQDFIALQVDKQRLDLDLSLASDIQKTLLPQVMPRVPGLDIDARYVAAQKVSGDLYDVIDLGGGRVGLAVADVSGKGIGASLLMAICRTLLRQNAARHVSPAQVLTEINRALQGDVRDGMFVTMVYAVVDVAAGSLTFARAGHEKPLLARRHPGGSGVQCEFLASEGLPLGLADEATFSGLIEDKTASFPSGATLVLYSDGLTEAANAAGAEFGSARLSDALHGVAGSPAAAVNDAIFAALGSFGAQRLRDDYTLCTVTHMGRE
jgi:sigma-B regulation protein RsbU (phosphoserine phosphatase)